MTGLLVLRRAAVLLALAGAAPAAPADKGEAALELALAPYISVRPLMSLFQPLAAFLEARLGRPVLLVTAPTLREFDARALGSAYELALMGPHAARLAQREAGYVPLLRVSDDLSGLFLIPAASSLRSLRDLRGVVIAFPDRFTATAQLGQQALASLGLPAGQAVYPSGFQDSLLLSVLRGDYPALLMNASAFHQMRPEYKQQVRILGETRRIPNVMFVAHPDMPAAARATVREALVEFWERSPAGRRFAAHSGLTGVRLPTAAELRSLDALALEHKRLFERRERAGTPR